MNKISRGLMIAVFGPDGTGKSTIYKNLVIECSLMKIGLTNQHWRPGFLRYKNLSSETSTVQDFNTPHLYSQRNQFISIIIILYIFLDFILGYYFMLKPKLKRGLNIYYERYFYDILIDQIRYRLKVPLFLRKILASLVINPDLIIILDAPESVIYERKQELSINEILRQKNILRTIFNNKKNIIRLDVEVMDAKTCSFEICKFLK